MPTTARSMWQVLGKLAKLSAAIDNPYVSIRPQKEVLFHCQNGVHRAPTACAIIISVLTGCSMEDRNAQSFAFLMHVCFNLIILS